MGRLGTWGRHPVPAWGLEDLIDHRTYRRIRKHARRMGMQGPLTAVRLTPRLGGPGLEVVAGGWPVARLLDLNRDGWAETLLLAEFGRGRRIR
jgi:hypothetical protein